MVFFHKHASANSHFWETFTHLKYEHQAIEHSPVFTMSLHVDYCNTDCFTYSVLFLRELGVRSNSVGVFLTLLQYNVLYCIKWFITFITYSMYSMGTMLYSQHTIQRVTSHSPLYWMISWACFILLKQAQNNVLQVESKSIVTNMSPPQALALHLLDLWCQM